MDERYIDLSKIVDLNEEKEYITKEEWDEVEFYNVMNEELEKQEKSILDNACNKIMEMLAEKMTTTIQQQNNEDEVLGKEEIKSIMNYKDDGTALRFLKVAMKYGYAAKVGKSYKITRKNLNKFLKYMEGQNFDL